MDYPKWEYLEIGVPQQQLGQALGQAGEEGWELVSSQPILMQAPELRTMRNGKLVSLGAPQGPMPGVLLIFKRPKATADVASNGRVALVGG